MQKQKTWSLLMVEVAVVIFITSGCPSRLWDITSPPYLISKPSYQEGGVAFDFCNRSSKTVIYIETKMNVPDRGCITSSSPCSIQKNLQNNFCISLEEYFSNAIPSSLVIDNFYISKIRYSDGSEWKDYLGVYADYFTLEV